MKKIFEEFKKDKASVNEERILKHWEEIDILNKTIENRPIENNYVFYDGPAYANGYPGLHHMLAKFLKDTFCKYKTMKGHRVIRKIGWDTHGLPIESKVEAELGFKSKKDIENFGIENFNKKCKESVLDNEKAFVNLTKKMGQFIDTDNPYLTYKDYFIETEWWILKKFFEEGLFYEGNKILPYCHRCGTGLASHEVAQGYKEVNVDTVIVTMKKKDEDAYFLVWTTTPWTLISNVALCVNPNESYVKVDSAGYKFILSEKLVNKVLGDNVEILEKYTGKDLEYTEYEQLLPFIDVEEKAFYVTCDDYVTTEDGTGIVHIAPAFGEDDNKIGKKYKLPTLNPVGSDGKYNIGPWKDMLVFDADLEVIKYLKENDKLFKKQRIVHNYPHCWRCDSPLIYYSSPSYYLEITKIKDKIIEANKTVNWYPSYVGEKRFANWLENLNDWAISRTRYWGTPLPFWKCNCGHTEMIGSKKELIEKSLENIDESIELHRPYVDNVHLKCQKCGGNMTRTPEVIDVWFDAGSMPFGQYHYPFENQELWKEQFPADFICEGIDQTRGWFYTLMVISVFVKGVSPFKNVLVNDLILDKDGKKMSKSRGNVVEPFTTIEEFGADVIRWYLPYSSAVWTPMKFDIEGLKEVNSKFFNTLKNTYTFFQLYANTDEIDPRTFSVEYNDREEIDKWLLSKYNKLVKYVTDSYEEYDLTKVVKSITDFVNEDLSNWYIRRNRRRFWASELDDSKKSVYNTTYEVLLGLTKLIAPIIPFISEDIYQKLTKGESVHLTDFPVYDEKYIDDAIEEKMDLVRDLISLGRFAREEAKIKVRQPIDHIIVNGKYKDIIGDLDELIIEELNVKDIHFEDNLNIYMNFEIKPDFKVAGPIFGKNIKLFQEYLTTLNDEQIKEIENNKTLTFTIDTKKYEITKDMIDIRITSKDGYNAQMQNNKFIILDTTLSKELIEEGIVREFVSKVQQMRKNNNYDVIDRINIYYDAIDDFDNILESYNDYIRNETLALNINKTNLSIEPIDINGLDIKISIEKSN